VILPSVSFLTIPGLISISAPFLSTPHKIEPPVRVHFHVMILE
jgi:hypothetical protein